MAQRYRSSRSGSGGRRPAGGGRQAGGSQGSRQSRGGYRQAPQRSNGGMGPIIIAIVLVVGAVGLIVALSSGGSDERDRAPETSYTPPPPPSSQPDVPQPPPYPPISAGLKQKAKDIAREAAEIKKEGEKIYQEAMAARRADDQDLWQAKLGEASDLFLGIQDLYNELLEEMYDEIPSDCPYDVEEVANHYLGREADTITRAISRLTDIKKQRRM